MIEATISAANTFIRFYRQLDPSVSHYCFVDTVEPEMILNALESKFEAGLLSEVEEFFSDRGRAITDPASFRIKLDAIVRPTHGSNAQHSL